MMLGICENGCRPSNGRSVPRIRPLSVLTDPFKRKVHSSEKNYLCQVLRNTFILYLAMTHKDNSFSLLCVGNSVEIFHLVRVQN